MEEDILELIPGECKITFSQDEKLKKCRFALESEENEEEEDSPPPDSIQLTGIVMVSPAEGNEESLEGDVFHTPPEQQQSQLSGSEDQGLVIGNEVGGFTQPQNAVELGKDSVALGFSELDCGNCVMDSDAFVFLEPNVVDCVKHVVCEPDLSASITKRTVHLGKDSNTLVVSDMNVVKRIDGVKDVVCDPDLSKTSTERTVDVGKDSNTLVVSEMNVVKRIEDVQNVASDRDLSKSSMERTVDFAKDSDTLLFSEVNVIKRIDHVQNVASDRDLSKSSMERTVDLVKDSDTLMFTEVNLIKRIGGVKDVASDCDLSIAECDLKGCKVLESECGQSFVNECNVSAENMEYTEPIVIKSENVEIEETEVVNMEVEESCEEMGASESTKSVEERVEGENSGGHSTGQNVEEYAAGGYVNGGELLNSFMEPEQHEGLSVFQQAWNDVNTIMDILEAAEDHLVEGTTDTDFIKAAEERGLIFNRPRWWPPEGFDD